MMKIREMSKGECLAVLARTRVARLGCARENQPYVVPVYLAYEPTGCLYGFTTPGQKVEWMRANPLVCVEVDEIAAVDQWVSVIVFGHYEELPESLVSKDATLRVSERPQAAEAVPAWPVDSRRRTENKESPDEEELKPSTAITAHPGWWEPASTVWAARIHRTSTDPFISIYYRIRIDSVTGHEATRNPRDATLGTMQDAPTGRWARLCRRLSKIVGGK